MAETTRPWLIALAWMLLPALAGVARGDGGTVRLRARAGPYQVTVFTSPTPLRAGPLDVSFLVQGAGGEVLLGVSIEVEGRLREGPGLRFVARATREQATNRLLHAAQVDLPAAGWWDLDVRVEGPRGRAELSLALEAGPPSPGWWEVWPWLTWPVAAVALFALHQMLLARQRGRGRPPQGAP